jgi:hypothetical protein
VGGAPACRNERKSDEEAAVGALTYSLRCDDNDVPVSRCKRVLSHMPDLRAFPAHVICVILAIQDVRLGASLPVAFWYVLEKSTGGKT